MEEGGPCRPLPWTRGARNPGKSLGGKHIRPDAYGLSRRPDLLADSERRPGRTHRRRLGGSSPGRKGCTLWRCSSACQGSFTSKPHETRVFRLSPRSPPGGRGMNCSQSCCRQKGGCLVPALSGLPRPGQGPRPQHGLCPMWVRGSGPRSPLQASTPLTSSHGGGCE